MLLKRLRVCRFHRPLVRFFCDHIPGEGDYDLQLARHLNQDPEFLSICQEYYKTCQRSQGLFIAQPFFKFKLDEPSPPELRFQEAVSLVRSVPSWKAIDGGLFPVNTFQKPYFFTEQVLKKLHTIISNNPLITSLFIGVDKLFGRQQCELEKILSVPVYDRFSVIMEIFRAHAKTGEAMLQIQLAEIPYLFSRIQQYHEAVEKKPSYGVGYRGAGQTEKPIRKYKRFLDERAKTIKKALVKVDTRRSKVVQRRKKLDIPSIAVIGYTNSGKTSLIKALSNRDNLQPEDRLFATLDITAHHFTLPSFKDTLLLDSIGFISNIPHELLDSFNVTFKDVANSDLLLHVYDISHPDLKNQIQTVYSTLKQLSVPENMISFMVNAANKVDLLEEGEELAQEQDLVKPEHIKCSALDKINIGPLIEEVDKSLVLATDRSYIKLRVPSGGEEFRWLQKESKIQSFSTDETDGNYIIVKTAISPASRKKFSHYFSADFVESINP